jgi:HEAT repeat protein
LPAQSSPPNVLVKRLKKGNDATRVRLLRSLAPAYTIPTEIAPLAISWLKEARSLALETEVLGHFKSFVKALSRDVPVNQQCPRDENDKVMSICTNPPNKNSKLLKDLFQAAEEKLKDPDSDIWCEAMKAIHYPSSGPRLISEAEVQLESKSLKSRENAINYLGTLSGLGQTPLEKVLAALGNKDSKIQSAAAVTLQNQSGHHLEVVLHALIEMLNCTDSKVQANAIRALHGRQDLPEHILQMLLDRIDSEDSDIQRRALACLRSAQNLLEIILQALSKAMRSGNSKVRRTAISTLTLFHLPGEIEMLLPSLKDDDPGVRSAVLRALQNYSSDLPETGIQDLEDIVENFDEDRVLISVDAIELLAKQPKLAERPLRVVEARLQDKDLHFARSSLRYLQRHALRQSDIPETAFQVADTLFNGGEPMAAYAREFLLDMLCYRVLIAASISSILKVLLRSPTWEKNQYVFISAPIILLLSPKWKM